MIISRTRGFKFSLGSYEMLDVSCAVTISHLDLGYTDADARDIDTDTLAKELTDKCMEVMDEQLAGEIEEARKLSNDERSVLSRAEPASDRSRTRTRKARRA